MATETYEAPLARVRIDVTEREAHLLNIWFTHESGNSNYRKCQVLWAKLHLRSISILHIFSARVRYNSYRLAVALATNFNCEDFRFNDQETMISVPSDQLEAIANEAIRPQTVRDVLLGNISLTERDIELVKRSYRRDEPVRNFFKAIGLWTTVISNPFKNFYLPKRLYGINATRKWLQESYRGAIRYITQEKIDVRTRYLGTTKRYKGLKVIELSKTKLKYTRSSGPEIFHTVHFQHGTTIKCNQTNNNSFTVRYTVDGSDHILHGVSAVELGIQRDKFIVTVNGKRYSLYTNKLTLKPSKTIPFELETQQNQLEEMILNTRRRALILAYSMTLGSLEVLHYLNVTSNLDSHLESTFYSLKTFSLGYIAFCSLAVLYGIYVYDVREQKIVKNSVVDITYMI